jgi:hypothetical protein
MKSITNGAMHRNGDYFPTEQFTIVILKKVALFFCSTLFAAILLISCKKEVAANAESQPQSTNANSSEAEFMNFYNYLSPQTSWELQQARAATAKYRNIDNAIRDGYADINVVVPEMGFHLLRSDNVDATFDFKKPEILVYNRDEDGTIELVAVEYAVPLNLSANAPAGFTGNLDVWDHNTTFGLWLLHAWVWHYNPSGVFNPTNPLVHLH